MNKYVCIHGHFYQPPRENPWLEAIEIQESAYPYHDWNARITDECYAPNAASRILDSERRIVDIVNNYSKISFNFGPTLLSWMEHAQPDVYQSILFADVLSQNNFSGHGSALAQCYNHMIMPLSNRRDKESQVVWGIRDFEYRFKRKPAGMWLPETAVDLETLEILAETGIQFTVLAPGQAAQIKPLKQTEWKDVSGGRVNTQIPYQCPLPSGKLIHLFFYDGSISQSVAFGGLLNSGIYFAERLIGAFAAELPEGRLVHIATDGETYGHHHRFGDMALSYCLHYLQTNQLAKLTIYAEYLEKFPATHAVRIVENSSWSCLHGVERWRKHCGCNSGMHPPGWNQEWREKLRESIDWLRDQIIPIYEREISAFAVDPWQIRNSYVQVVLNRNEESLQKFFQQFHSGQISAEERVKILMWMEVQRHAMLMYTSCGWFFDEISGLESSQVIEYAARVIQLVQDLQAGDFESGFLDLLRQAPSNIPEMKNGAEVYNRYGKSSKIDLNQVAVHAALRGLFEESDEDQEKIFSYELKKMDLIKKTNAETKLVFGQWEVGSTVTQQKKKSTLAIVHLGEYQLKGGLKDTIPDEATAQLKSDLPAAFERQAMPEVLNLIEQHLGLKDYTLWDLLDKEDQEKVLNLILDPSLKEIESLYTQIYTHHSPLMQSKTGKRIHLPKPLATTAEFVLNRDIRQIVENDPLDLQRLQALVNDILRWSFELDQATLNFVASRRINQLLEIFSRDTEELSQLKTINKLLKILNQLPVKLNLWKSQNHYFFIGKKFYPRKFDQSKIGNSQAQDWVQHFETLGSFLDIKL